jgi:hypothetical protein
MGEEEEEECVIIIAELRFIISGTKFGKELLEIGFKILLKPYY